MKKPVTFIVSVLIKQEEHLWVAQGLEYDIAAQGKSIPEALKAFEKTFAGQILLDIIEKRAPLEGITKAPQDYWDMFQEGQRLKDTECFNLPKEIPEGFIIDSQPCDLRIYA